MPQSSFDSRLGRVVDLLDTIELALEKFIAGNGEFCFEGVGFETNILAAAEYLRQMGYVPDATRLEREGKEVLNSRWDIGLAEMARDASPERRAQLDKRFGLPPKGLTDDDLRLLASGRAAMMKTWLPILTEQLRAQAAPEANPGEGETNAEAEAFCFAPSGSGYFIRGFGEAGHVSDLKGFRHIAKFIEVPGKSVLMADLVSEQETAAAADLRSRQPALDGEAKHNLYGRLQQAKAELDRAREDNDTVEQRHCEEEIEHLQLQLSAATGIGGKDRDLNSKADKLRPSIHSNLRRAYDKLRAADPPMSELADHFQAAIGSEGCAFVYRPVDGAPAWSSVAPVKK